MARTLKMMHGFTILKYYFPKNSHSILLSVGPHSNLSVVIQNASEGQHTKTVSFVLGSDKHAKLILDLRCLLFLYNNAALSLI